jgi:CrcB protein
MQTLTTYLWVALGGALGSVGRHWFSTFAVARWGAAFPWGTLLINISGSLIIGVIAGCNHGWLSGENARKFLMIGICGGFTTFSAFSLQTLELAQKGEWLRAVIYILASVALCILGVWGGFQIGSVFSPSKAV